MSTVNNQYLDALTQAERMLSYALENTDTLTNNGIGDVVRLMAKVQSVQSKISAVEKRLRPAIIDVYDCKEGGSKTHSLEELNLKVQVSRPVSYIMAGEVTYEEASNGLGEELANDLFPAKRSFSKTNFNKLNSDQTSEVAAYIELKPGAVAVKITALN